MTSTRVGFNRRRLRGAALSLACVLLCACSGQQSAITPQGPVADRIAWFFWIMTGAAGAILALVLLLLLAGVFRGRQQAQSKPLTYIQSRNLVLVSGVVMPVVVLLGFTLFSAMTDRVVAKPMRADAITVEIIGHQWWWEVHYLDNRQQRIATTANEIHIPVGQPVRLLLKATDVIHSFWVPNLSGKTDMIPGKTNTGWLQADQPGTFRGQCGEFCGLQHARMAFWVEAQPAGEFQSWLARQREPAAAPDDPVLARGQAVFLASQCVMCHAVRGTRALGRVAPDLTHFGGRKTLAAASVPNSRGHLAGWILDPQGIKPGNFMPPTALAPDDLSALLDYLHSLK
ncbi:cytochrome c oxidase subunit II [Methylobacter sp. BBA5.1]|uniref:cytochrome c oxidase subunit II n=1 Tax=Methylobacter sp. BBA5.1 TaxID=1495064 RepID=UPI000569B09B|nr:cytochrome c oxidase subunit II [Methylobacter sp. BBA5.1]